VRLQQPDTGDFDLSIRVTHREYSSKRRSVINAKAFAEEFALRYRITLKSSIDFLGRLCNGMPVRGGQPDITEFINGVL
jgi:hypothetical protein